mmetsp:Transcript_26915/g.52516  ORF Transcript_26915/g.52516 Transcript_26915/m.52516 type:complete len:556 (-) Transcript_26915:167-1834(-)
MAHWGIGYASGSNYNNPMMLDSKAAYQSSQHALKMSKDGKCSQVERDMIEALAKRYTWPYIDQNTDPEGATKQKSKLGQNYADAMRDKYLKHPKNSDIAFWFAEALMNLRPWRLWEPDPETKKVPEDTEFIVKVLEEHLKLCPTHPGLCHMYIHAMELSPSPSKALAVSNALLDQGGLVPGSGHLLHMPSHIYMWVGNYERAVESNRLAFETDQEYLSITGHTGGIYRAYRMHNLHFLVWAAMFDGQYSTSMKYALQIQNELTAKVLKECGLAQYLEAFAMTRMMVLIRFGKWREILKEPFPKDEETFPAVLATTHYGRGMAYAALGLVEEAEVEQSKFEIAVRVQSCTERILHNNRVFDPEGTCGILNVAQTMLSGEIKYRKGNYEGAFKDLKEAVRRDDALPYDEPWGWMQPARHALGALLSEQKRYKTAREVFLADLTKWPGNLWSLMGLHKCEEALGNHDEAKKIFTQFKLASKRLDETMEAPCACANGRLATTPQKNITDGKRMENRSEIVPTEATFDGKSEEKAMDPRPTVASSTHMGCCGRVVNAVSR